MKYLKKLLIGLYLIKLRISYAGYQPIPWLKLEAKDRTRSTYDRWDAIEKNIGEIVRGSALDIGSNVGFFTLKYAHEGFFTIGVERYSGSGDFANFIRHQTKTENVAFSHMEITPKNINTLPEVDLINLLSVWHHWVQEFGLQSGNQMLETVWKKTKQCLIFEGGEDTEIQKLGIVEDPKTWTKQQLQKVCEGGEIIEIGSFSSEHPTDPVMRTLYMIKKIQDT